ncbi:MAG TPA: lipoyl synthase [Acidimicrobiales bacterium]|nr:lipoyl synthase [Acidimicrobiales bacterium]
MADPVLRVRSLGRVRYRDGHALQRALFHHSHEEYLLLLEHNHVYTLGVRARPEHVLADPAEHGAELVRADRGGDVTYHGPGQLVGYPILNVALKADAIPAYVHRVEELVLATLRELGLTDVGRMAEYPGVWVEPDGPRPRKICAVGVRVSRGRTMHGFALNVEPDLAMFDHIVPCGIEEYPVTSLAAEGVASTVAAVAEIVARLAPRLLAEDGGRPYALEAQVATPPEAAGGATGGRALERRLDAAGVDRSQAVALSARKPEWLRVEARMGEDYLGLRRTMRRLDLVTVCEEAGCPNIYECWADGTATFMINGERCTRACGFCLVDTSHPLPLDPSEPRRVAEAAVSMHLGHAVVTAVARDDLPDGGAGAFAETIAAIRAESPGTAVEVLIPDVKGDERALQSIFDARPDVLNHNLETVLRLQRAVRPSASYARSLAVLGRAKAAGLTTKSGIILGMGEEEHEVLAALADLAAVGVDIVTIGQYLRPSAAHLPVARFWTPEEFARLAAAAREMGFAHVEASPLTRSSYHARQAAEAGAAALSAAASA